MNNPEQNLKSPVLLRNATEADVPFIFNSWLKSFKPSVGSVSNPVYYEFQHKLIEQILQRCQVKVLCSADDQSQICGYIVYETVDNVLVLHYAYVKHTYRKLGLLKQLCAGLELSGFYTHQTSAASKLAKKYSLVYNPYLAYGVK